MFDMAQVNVALLKPTTGQSASSTASLSSAGVDGVIDFDNGACGGWAATMLSTMSAGHVVIAYHDHLPTQMTSPQSRLETCTKAR